MPIVFIHGVNNRDSKDYQQEVVARNGFLQEIIGPALGLNKVKAKVFNPYWGGFGAQFAWGMSVLPQRGMEYQTFGRDGSIKGQDEVELVLSSTTIDGKLTLVENARKNLSAVVDALYTTAMCEVATEEDAQKLAKSYLIVSAYVDKNPSPEWLYKEGIVDTNFTDELFYHAEVSEEHEAFGSGILDSIKEGLSRLGSALPRAGTQLLERVGREKLNLVVARFAGDAFVYLKKRGTKESPGDIVSTVLQDLNAAKSYALDNSEDNKLIVIAHSFGGEIIYDIMTFFDPDLEIDCLITVGSQVGLFAEMQLYVESETNMPKNPPPPEGHIPKPVNLKRWINVFDLSDVFSYRVEPVFSDCSDFQYDTGYSVLGSHSGYFLRPSFYKRLASRLEEE